MIIKIINFGRKYDNYLYTIAIGNMFEGIFWRYVLSSRLDNFKQSHLKIHIFNKTWQIK